MSSFKKRMNAIKAECARQDNLSEILSSLWSMEIDLYEDPDWKESFVDLSNFDLRLFPYHRDLFPLRDFIFTLSSEESSTPRPTFSFDTYFHNPTLPSMTFEPHRRLQQNSELPIVSYCPCSAYAVMITLVPPHRAAVSRNLTSWDESLTFVSNDDLRSSFFSFLDEWNDELIDETWENRPDNRADEALSNSSFGVNNILPEERFVVLSRVLKHATSNLQRDHRLARVVLLLMIEYKLLNDEENLRTLLLILSSEYQICKSWCHQEYIDEHGHEDDDNDNDENYPQHYCDDYQKFLSTLRDTLAYGMTVISDKAVMIILGFVNNYIEPIAWSRIGGPIPLPQDCEWDVYDDKVYGDKVHLIVDLISAVHAHGCLAKRKIVNHLRRIYSSSHPVETRDSVDIPWVAQSYENCLRCLLHIGETFLLRLQPRQGISLAGGLLVKALVTLLHAEYFPLETYSGNEYLGSVLTAEGSIFPPVVSVTRYSDLIKFASEIPQKRLEETQKLLLCSDTKLLRLNSLVQKIFLSPVSKDILTIVRGLFLQELVDLRYSCCGYGDFLVWCKQPISCYDKVLYSYESHFPMNDDLLEDRHWGVSANGLGLNNVEISAIHDCALLLLKKTWNQPWSISSHPSFPRTFHDSMRVFALCAGRKRLPTDLLMPIFEYWNRSWFSDVRSCCWKHECQVSQIYDEIRGFDNVHKVIGACPKCSLCLGCSVQHAVDLLKEGHKRSCGLGSLRQFGAKEDEFCKLITTPSSALSTTSNETTYDDVDSHDDDSSWESVNSELENRFVLFDEKTQGIISFFLNDYKILNKRSEADYFLRTGDGDY